MKIYTVHHPARAPRQIETRCEATEFVKEGFSWPGFLFGPVWLFCRGLWLLLAAYLAVAILFAVAGTLLRLSGNAEFIAWLVFHLLIGFEGNNLVRWTLRRRGLADLGVVIAESQIEAERQFFAGMLERGEDPAPEEPAAKKEKILIAGTPSEGHDGIGLFPAPGASS